MHRVLNLFVAAAFVLFADIANAAHTEASLLLGAETARPGDTVMAGIRLHMETGWHTYWKNSGASGAPTKIEWQLPSGVTAGEIQWPLPEKTAVSELTTYVYDNEVVLLIPLKLAADLKPGTLELTASNTWLECNQDRCVPGKAVLQATLNIGGETKPSADATLLGSWKNKIPQTNNFPLRAWWEKPANGNMRSLIIGNELMAAAKNIKHDSVDFFPYASDEFEIQPATEIISAYSADVRLRKSVKKFSGDWPKEISGVLVIQDGALRIGVDVKLPVRESEVSQTSSATNSLWLMLLHAFIGGLILNVMPCVFPVIALKILGFVQQSHEEPRRVFRLGLIYGLGVLVSFIVMAGMVIALQQAGGSASWGMQFKSPQFSVALIVLVVLIALNLFGLFEINLGGGTMNAAGQLASKHGAAGAFFNGVLATVLATPCTAPVLATALGFAFAQPPVIVLLFFIAIGLGLAAPYILLSWKPGWLKFLPRPGAWMEKFKVVMGFPMLATAIWIFWFTAPRFGDSGELWLGWFLVSIALVAWIWGQFVQRGGKRRGLAILICLALLFGSYTYALESKLHWRNPVAASLDGEPQNDPDKVQWKKWSAAAIEKARSEGRPILVDFTAKWCVTCNAFVKPAVDNADVRQKLENINGVALLADNSNYPEDIITELKKFHSDAGVPLVLVYPKDSGKPPVVLPAIPSKHDVLKALTDAAK